MTFEDITLAHAYTHTHMYTTHIHTCTHTHCSFMKEVTFGELGQDALVWSSRPEVGGFASAVIGFKKTTNQTYLRVCS